MKYLGRIFLTGVLTVLPVLATVYLLIWLFTTAESFLGKPLQWLIPEGFYRAGMGLVVGMAVIFAVGILMRAYIVRRLFQFTEKLLLQLPLIKTIYAALRDFFGLFAGQDDQVALQVVTVRLPGSDMRLMGFVTRDHFSDLPDGVAKEGEVAVYLPMSYQIGGYTVFMPRSQITPIAMSREQAMRFVLTAGLRAKPSDT
ncbi:MAG: hypothetical protein AMJ66_08320 [Betaproteobacteria bacterium SG8_40]|jgi:uncharacterized membrane protein|nr:MAG: hypothetical protein AMJ66_08320 [Betaproteobacteria bacterium SG8_40]